jgi:hypothetical protein
MAHKLRKKTRLTPESVSANVDFIGSILQNSSHAEFEYWRKQLPELHKFIKAGLRKKFNITF